MILNEILVDISTYIVTFQKTFIRVTHTRKASREPACRFHNLYALVECEQAIYLTILYNVLLNINKIYLLNNS